MNTFDIRIRNAAIATLLCAFAAAQALAASPNAAKPDFKAYDQNSDGMVSLEEFVAQGGNKGKEFLAADVNKDNHLSSDELIEATASKTSQAPAPQTPAPQTQYR
ncbi:MAG: hypothetical protein Q8K12_18670 [Thiobacillus sp.]|nr:hypothetical protein [Thiobacillus sp.]